MEIDEEVVRSNVVAVAIIFVMFVIMGILLLTSCTYSITMVHTEGSATDVVDETATNSPSTEATIPVSLTGGK
jgi:hypothetical protein